MNDIERFLTNVGKGTSSLAKDEILSFYNWTVDQGGEFTKKQKAKVDRYLLQLALQEITKQEFVGYIADIKTLAEMELLKMEVAQKAAAQRLISGIQDLLIGNLLKLL